jgi:DNA-K related protein
VEQLWKMLATPGKSGTSVTDGGADYWIMWRRVAGGLSTAIQNTLVNRLRPMLIPAKGKNVAKPGTNELAEMWRAAASLERIDVKTKEALGAGLLRQVARANVANYVFWSLTRIGARSLFYGPLNLVLHPQLIETWLEELLVFQPTHESETKSWAFCVANLARRTGQRALDIDDTMRERVVAILGKHQVPALWTTMVREVTAMASEERGQLFGESLPIGLRLLT